jgi:hypothetical protein
MSRRVSFVLVMGLLMCTLSTLEVPEFIKLTDNTSNDYSTVVFQKNKTISAALRTQPPDVVRLVVVVVPTAVYARPALRIESSELFDSLPDLLHLFCVQRT